MNQNSIDFRKLNIMTDDLGNVTNSQEIIDYLKDVTLDDESFEYMNSLLNRIKFGELENIDSLIEAISAKILEYQAQIDKRQSNLQSLRQMQAINDDLKKLDIKSTKRVDNDSNKYIDYLTYTREDGQVEVLVCQGENTLNEYIQSHADEVASLSAEEIFEHFKKYVHRDLIFKTEEQMNMEKEAHSSKYTGNAVDQVESERINEELANMKEFKQQYGLTGQIKMGKDTLNNERIYQLDGGLFKFQKIGDRLERQTIQEPRFREISNDDLLNELNSSEESIQRDTIDTKIAVTENETISNVEEHGIEEGTEKINKEEKNINYIDLHLMTKDTFSVEIFKQILDKKDVYEGELTIEEEEYLEQGVKFLIETMQDRIENPEEKEYNAECDSLLDRYMNAKPFSNDNDEASRTQRFDEISEGVRKETDLTELEVQFIKHYYENQRYLKEAGLTNKMDKTKKMVLDKYNEHKTGIATVVMLLEMVALAALIILFMHVFK